MFVREWGAPVHPNPPSWLQTPVMSAWKSAKAFQTVQPASWFHLGPLPGSDAYTQKDITWGTSKRN